MRYEFTDRVRAVLAVAREHAIRMGHGYVGTEHLLLGLLDGPGGEAAPILAEARDSIRDAIEESVRAGVSAPAAGELPYTSRAKKALEYAMASARELRDAVIDTEHLLLGLLKEERGLAGQVLIANGVTIERVRDALDRERPADREVDVLVESPAPPSRVGGRLGSAVLSRAGIPILDSPVPHGFTREARYALKRAWAVALKLGHDYVGTEHILAAVVADRRGIVRAALDGLEVDRAQLLEPVTEAAHRPAARRWRSGARMKKDLPYTRRAMNAMEFALFEARRELREAGPEHLLIGVLLESSGMGAKLLVAAGVSLKKLRDVFANMRDSANTDGGEADAAADDAPAASDATEFLDATPVWFLELDASSDTPIYEQIIAGIEEAVATNRLVAGERLPPVRQLAEELGVAPGTVARAYSHLEKQGVLETEGARGTRVAARSPATGPADARVVELEQGLRAVVVQGYHLGATADEVRRALDKAMDGIYG